MSAKNSPPPAPIDTPPAGRPWSAGAKALVSVLLVWHVTAVLYGPLNIPLSMIGAAVRPIYRPYLAATHLGHGYKFFAPEPGPSHLIRYELQMPDGSQQVATFPDKQDHWPRLFYHRHFMLTEHLDQFDPFPPPGIPPSELPTELAPTQATFARSYADHLLNKYGAESVSLYLIEHRFPTPDEVLGGMPLDDPRLYRERSLGVYAGPSQPRDEASGPQANATASPTGEAPTGETL